MDVNAFSLLIHDNMSQTFKDNAVFCMDIFMETFYLCFRLKRYLQN